MAWIERQKLKMALSFWNIAPVLLVLTGCMDRMGGTDQFVPELPGQRFPIQVTTAPVYYSVTSLNGTLGGDHMNGLINFAQRARNDGSRHMMVQAPASSPAPLAAQIRQVLAQQGVSVTLSSYNAPPSAPVRVSYLKSGAMTKACGDWSGQLTADSSNRPYADFGCSQYHNVAAMVSDPQDFLRPRTMTSSPTFRRTKALSDYAKAPTGSGSVSGTTSSTSETKD